MGLKDTLDELAAKLSGVAPSVFGKAAIAQAGKPPRIAWVRLGGAPSGRKAFGGSIVEYGFEVEVHLWGKTDEDLERMHQALIQALRIVLLGRNFKEGRASYKEDQPSTNGQVLVVPVTIYLQVSRAELPDEGSAVGDPSTTVSDDVPGEVLLEDIELDPDGAVAGDGELQGGESP